MSISTTAANASVSQTVSTGFSYAGYSTPSVPIITIGGGSAIGSGYNFANVAPTDSTNNVFKVSGDAVFDGNASFNDITIEGKNLAKVLERIEERLALLHPNPELESRWEELADLRMKYMELEREIIEKEKIWAILNK